MKEIIIKKTVFEFNELSEKAKEKAKEDFLANEYLQENKIDFMLDEFEREIEKFEDGYTELKLQYDFSCCQGSGLNIYGSIGAKDIYMLAENEKIFTDDEMDRFAFYSNYLPELILSENKRYNYSLKDIDWRNLDIENDLILDSSFDGDINSNKICENIENLMLSDFGLINKIYQFIFDYLIAWEHEMYEKTLKDLTTAPNNEIMEELSKCNEWYYYADGSLATDIL